MLRCRLRSGLVGHPSWVQEKSRLEKTLLYRIPQTADTEEEDDDDNPEEAGKRREAAV